MKRPKMLLFVGFLILALLMAGCGAEGQDSPGGGDASDGGDQGSGGEVAGGGSSSGGGGQQPSGPPTPTPFVYSGPQPAAGTGNVYGRLLWNGQPVVGATVRLCDEVEFMGGCQGLEYSTTSDENGVYLFTDIDPITYALTYQDPVTQDWFYITSGLLNAADFEVSADQVLNAGDLNIVKYDMTLLEPADESQLSDPRPTLAWEAYAEAEYYEIVLSPQRGSSIFLFEELVETSIAPPVDLLNCNYGWYLKAYNSQGIQIAETEGIWHFDMVDQPYSCNVTGLSPADGAAVKGEDIVLSWDAHELAVYYKVNMYNADDSSISVLDFVRSESPSYTITQSVPAGEYTWVVYAHDQSDDFFAFSATYTLLVTEP